jgi:hypothetical protein
LDNVLIGIIEKTSLKPSMWIVANLNGTKLFKAFFCDKKKQYITIRRPKRLSRTSVADACRFVAK